nr:hypothetical protein [Tanacetum cinerariifolium]
MSPKRSEGEELEYPFFEGDGSSSDKWGDYGVAGDDYEGPPVFDDDQYEEKSVLVYDTDIEDRKRYCSLACTDGNEIGRRSILGWLFQLHNFTPHITNCMKNLPWPSKSLKKLDPLGSKCITSLRDTSNMIQQSHVPWKIYIFKMLKAI